LSIVAAWRAAAAPRDVGSRKTWIFITDLL
jgi:hypothetical protein